MPAWLIKLFQSLGRKAVAKRTGIAQIPTRISAEAKGAEYFNILVDAGLKPKDMSKYIKSEKDIIRLVNKVESLKKQKKPKVKKLEADVAKKQAEYDYINSEKYIEDLWKKSPEELRALMRKQGLTPVEDRPFQGFTPKIVPKDKTLLKDSPEAIAKIKAENKAAAERLRKKKEAEELFTDERPPKDPDFASGGIARVGFSKGKLAKWLLSLG